ncbi:MAG: 5'-nucleotidase C-terminal domain-containing protein [Deltaproteobacteria bacterium]|jgi:5'-nucleotidase/UDP-sugar diphosphatase|nr:5'-nucleotidase C-terminal domain-containing protein [Deltaproteobacteria bacterium]
MYLHHNFKTFYSFLLISIFGLSSCLQDSESPDIEGHDIKITFIHTADWHSRLIPYYLEVGETDKSLGLSDTSPTIGGAARAAKVIKDIRSGGQRVVHLDTGDVFQGAPIFNEFLGEPELRIYSQLNVDAFAIGNHEFDMGVNNFADQARAWATFPMLNINYALENPNYPGNSPLGSITHPYLITNVEGIKVAIIGIGSLGSIVSMYEGGNSLGITPIDTIDIAQFYIDFLRPLADVIVVSSHLGLSAEKQMYRASEDQMEGNFLDECEYEGTCETTPLCISNERLVGDEQLIANTEGIDIVFGGHLHIVLSPPEIIQDCRPDIHCPEIIANLENKGCLQATRDSDGTVTELQFTNSRRVPLMHSGAFLKFIGQLDAIFSKDEPDENLNEKKVALHNLNGWELKAFRQILHPMDDNHVSPEQFDTSILKLLDEYKQVLYRRLPLTRFIAYAPTNIRRFASGYGDSALGNLVATSMQTRRRVETDFALTNTLGIRSNIESGPVTIETMYNVFPFENTITTLTLSGAEIKSLLDYVALRSSRRGCQAQAQVAGVTFLMNCNNQLLPPFKEEGSYETAHRITIGGSRLTDPDNYGVDPATDKARCEYDGVRCISGGDPNDPDTCSDEVEPATSCPAGTEFSNGGCCPAGELCTPLGCGQPITMLASYTLAANDYIARGGSGFRVLQFNTTQYNTGIPLRDSVIDFLYLNFDSCGVRLDNSTIGEIDNFVNSSNNSSVTTVSDDFKDLISNLENNDFTRYASCAEDISEIMQKDCNYLTNNHKDECKIQKILTAVKMCLDIPCIEAKEEGRIERIFPISE